MVEAGCGELSWRSVSAVVAILLVEMVVMVECRKFSFRELVDVEQREVRRHRRCRRLKEQFLLAGS